MSPFTYYLLTMVMNDYNVLKVAIKVDMNVVNDEHIKYYREPENQNLLLSYVPTHITDNVKHIDTVYEIDFAITTGEPV